VCLRYVGDPRIAIGAENPHKVSNIVEPHIPDFVVWYRDAILQLWPIIHLRGDGDGDMQDINAESVFEIELGASVCFCSSFDHTSVDHSSLKVLCVHYVSQAINCLVQALPSSMTHDWNTEATPLPQLRAMLKDRLSSIVAASSTPQTVKGLLSVSHIKHLVPGWND